VNIVSSSFDLCSQYTWNTGGIAEIFLDSGGSILVFCIAEANSFGVMRAVVDKRIRRLKFEKKNYLLKFTEVLAVKTSDVPGDLYQVASKLGAVGLNVEYAMHHETPRPPTLVVPKRLKIL